MGWICGPRGMLPGRRIAGLAGLRIAENPRIGRELLVVREGGIAFLMDALQQQEPSGVCACTAPSAVFDTEPKTGRSPVL